MPVIKEWECKAHGYFDSPEQRCPHGCPEQFVDRVFLTAPNIRSGKTTTADQTLRGLAQDFGMTDIHGAREGQSVAEVTPASSAPFKAQWQPLNKNFDVRGMGMQSGNALEGLKSALSKPTPGTIVGRYDG